MKLRDLPCVIGVIGILGVIGITSLKSCYDSCTRENPQPKIQREDEPTTQQVRFGAYYDSNSR